MVANVKGGAGTFKPVGWSTEEVEEYKRACEEFNIIRSSQRAWSLFLRGEI